MQLYAIYQRLISDLKTQIGWRRKGINNMYFIQNSKQIKVGVSITDKIDYIKNFC
jgi:hypothetical protein